MHATVRRNCLGFSAARGNFTIRKGLLAGLIEFFGGSLVALGLFAGIAALIASGEMAVAYFQAHAPHGFWPIRNGGERAVFYCFFFLYVAATGSGRFSLDRLFGRTKQ